jgi:hypothetical protein
VGRNHRREFRIPLSLHDFGFLRPEIQIHLPVIQIKTVSEPGQQKQPGKADKEAGHGQEKDCGYYEDSVCFHFGELRKVNGE